MNEAPLHSMPMAILCNRHHATPLKINHLAHVQSPLSLVTGTRSILPTHAACDLIERIITTFETSGNDTHQIPCSHLPDLDLSGTLDSFPC